MLPFPLHATCSSNSGGSPPAQQHAFDNCSARCPHNGAQRSVQVCQPGLHARQDGQGAAPGRGERTYRLRCVHTQAGRQAPARAATISRLTLDSTQEITDAKRTRKPPSAAAVDQFAKALFEWAESQGALPPSERFEPRSLYVDPATCATIATQQQRAREIASERRRKSDGKVAESERVCSLLSR